jgi:hypothetical protein
VGLSRAEPALTIEEKGLTERGTQLPPRGGYFLGGVYRYRSLGRDVCLLPWATQVVNGVSECASGARGPQRSCAESVATRC